MATQSEYPQTVQYLQYTQRNKPVEDGGLLNPAYDVDVDYNGHDVWLQEEGQEKYHWALQLPCS